MTRNIVLCCILAAATLFGAAPAMAQGETNDELARKYYKLGSELHSAFTVTCTY